MKFVRAIWKLLVGIKDALVLIFMLLFFGLLYAALSARPAPVKDGVLDLDLKGSAGRTAGQGRMVRRRRRQPPARNIACATWSRRSTRRKDDSRVKAVALDLDGFTGGGQTAIGDLADAVRRVRAAGKPVVAYARRLYRRQLPACLGGVGSLAQPAGRGADRRAGRLEPLFQGPARQARRDRQRLSRRHLQVGGRAVHPQRHVARGAARITWRSARPMLETWRQSVHQARPKANVDLFLKDMNGAVAAAGGDMAKAALGAGLVDQHRRPPRLRGAARRSSAARTTRTTGRLQADQARRPTSPTSVDREAERARSASSPSPGMIVDGKARLRHRRRRHHRPGDRERRSATRASRRWSSGSTARAARCSRPSASARRCSRPRRRSIPVVVSMGSVAASGGYWVSTPADFIYAEPSTITGSIGVFGVLPSFQGTLQKLGIGADGVKTTPLSGEPDLLKGPSPEANQLIQTGVESIYRRFLGDRRRSRATRRPQQVDQIAQGRVWDGGTARQLGLVDGFGGMSEAIAKAARARQARRRARRPLSRAAARASATSCSRRCAGGQRRRRDARRTRSRCSPAGRSSSSRRRSPKCARSSPARASRRAASNARRSRPRRASTSRDVSLLALVEEWLS